MMTTPKKTTTTKGRSTISKRTAVNEQALLDQLDDERIQSGDLWCKVQAIEFYRNLLAKQRDSIEDRDWWRFSAQVLRLSEVTALYDSLIARAARRRLANGNSFRNRPPELQEGDSCSDVLEFLYKSSIHRTRFVDALVQLLAQREQELQKTASQKAAPPSALEQKFAEIENLFDLSAQERQVVLFLYLSDCGYWDLGDVFSGGRFRDERKKLSNLATALGLSETQAGSLLGSRGNLRRFGLLESNGLSLEDSFKDYLTGVTDTPLCDRYYTRSVGETLPWEMHGKLAEKEGKVLSDMILAKDPGKGQNILLYGLAGTGKTAFAQSLAAKLNKELYFIKQADYQDNRERSSGPNFRFSGLEIANLRLDPEKVIVCVDECDKMLVNVGSGEPFFRMFNLPSDRDGEGKGQLNAVLDTLKLTTIWIANSRRDSIDPSSRRRFDYNIYFDTLSASVRRNIWDNAIKRYGMEGRLNPAVLDEFTQRYQVNAGGIDVAVKNAAAVVKQVPDTDFAASVMLYLRSHCNLLNIVDNLGGNKPSGDYSLEGLNVKTGITLPRIISACKTYLQQMHQPGGGKDTPRLNVLLSGAPGTGKTEFVKYLAQTLDMPLNIKMASDMLDCYVGGTEHRIVNAFSEAAAEHSILFIDEGDSMLGTRAKATRPWEISQVTTLLNQMENFPGIFLMATNFIQNMDPAAMRRFTYKLHFDYLDVGGKLHFYGVFFKHLQLPALSQDDRKALEAIATLTPGDFRNVRQQFFYLAGTALSNAELIKALADEAASKDQQSLAVNFFDQRRIGFGL